MEGLNIHLPCNIKHIYNSVLPHMVFFAHVRVIYAYLNTSTVNNPPSHLPRTRDQRPFVWQTAVGWPLDVLQLPVHFCPGAVTRLKPRFGRFLGLPHRNVAPAGSRWGSSKHTAGTSNGGKRVQQKETWPANFALC